MESITGYVDHIVFQNSENGYTVMILMMEGEEVTCVGMCKGLGQGENITAEGEYIEHPVYGRQFKIQNYETVTPTDRVGMERYLGSGAIRGHVPDHRRRAGAPGGSEGYQRTKSTGDRHPDGRKKGSSGSAGIFAAIRHQ